MALDPRKSATASAVLGSWLALLALSFLPLWEERLGTLHRGTGLNTFWHFVTELYGEYSSGGSLSTLWSEQASNVATTFRVMLGGAVVGLLVHLLLRRGKCRTRPKL